MTSRLSTVWRAGRVQRCHVTPHIGDASNAAHQWGAARVALELFPDASRDLLVACLSHDDPELSTGDVPRPAKWASPLLSAELDNLESAFYKTYEIEFPSLSRRDTWRLAVADLTDLWLFCQHQRNLGNMYFSEIMARCHEHAAVLACQIRDEHPEDADVVSSTFASVSLSIQSNYPIER